MKKLALFATMLLVLPLSASNKFADLVPQNLLNLQAISSFEGSAVR